jgi:ABC-type multidrug transport system ATPase subunit
MKVKEIIEFYSDLKTSNESVESICTKFGLSKYLNTYTVNLSGGNKRKLTFAIAMMNKPTLLLLDEPSTGVDPESRRIMWRNINELSNSGHKYNMILTTHSMEEAEILCDTVSWLKAGNFICVGNPEELKIEYSAGYKLHIKFDDNEINKEINNDKVEDVFNTIKEYVDGFDIFENIILENKDLIVENYLNGLIKIVKKIKDKTKKISINEIGKDLSFELIIEIIKEKQKEIFTEILNMKNANKEISEINITMQSLENILTSLN